jgi:nitrite reductase/ring-hydroxylating ferredoxin subunit
MMNIRLVLMIGLIGLSSLHCRKDKEEIPYYYVNFKIFIDQPQYLSLQTPGNAMVLTSNVIGHNETPFGVIVYRETIDHFKAYERTCTFKPSEACAVEIDSNAIYAVCPCCGSEYLLINGDPSGGVAEMPLSQYYTEFNGTELYVYSY